MTNTVHSVGTLSIANPERTWSRLPCYRTARPELSPSGRFPHDNPRCLADKVQPRRLTDSHRDLRNSHRGFKLMKTATRWGSVNRDAATRTELMKGIFGQNRIKTHNSCG